MNTSPDKKTFLYPKDGPSTSPTTTITTSTTSTINGISTSRTNTSSPGPSASPNKEDIAKVFCRYNFFSMFFDNFF